MSRGSHCGDSNPDQVFHPGGPGESRGPGEGVTALGLPADLAAKVRADAEALGVSVERYMLAAVTFFLAQPADVQRRVLKGEKGEAPPARPPLPRHVTAGGTRYRVVWRRRLVSGGRDIDVYWCGSRLRVYLSGRYPWTPEALDKTVREWEARERFTAGMPRAECIPTSTDRVSDTDFKAALARAVGCSVFEFEHWTADQLLARPRPLEFDADGRIVCPHCGRRYAVLNCLRWHLRGEHRDWPTSEAVERLRSEVGAKVGGRKEARHG